MWSSSSTLWQQDEVCCCLRTDSHTGQHVVVVCSNHRPFLMEQVADLEEAAKVAERFRSMYVESHPPPG